MYIYAEKKRYEVIDIHRIANNSKHYKVRCENKLEEVTYMLAELEIRQGKLRLLPIINDIRRRQK